MEIDVLNYREEVLKQIKEADYWSECLYLSREHISKQLDWISDKLVMNSVNLSKLEEFYFLRVQNRCIRNSLDQFLTGRQKTSFSSCVALTDENRVNEAYHSFYEFIDDYGRRGNFVSEIEVKGIKMMIV